MIQVTFGFWRALQSLALEGTVPGVRLADMTILWRPWKTMRKRSGWSQTTPPTCTTRRRKGPCEQLFNFDLVLLFGTLAVSIPRAFCREGHLCHASRVSQSYSEALPPPHLLALKDGKNSPGCHSGPCEGSPAGVFLASELGRAPSFHFPICAGQFLSPIPRAGSERLESLVKAPMLTPNASKFQVNSQGFQIAKYKEPIT